MKHAVQGKQLNRDIASRRALFKNLMLALIEHGQIKTTKAKAQAVRSQFEKLVTKAKVGTLNDRRLIDEVLNQRKAVNTLVDEIAKAIKRTSGYTRIVKLDNRRGDDAEMVRLEIIDWQPKVAAPAKTETKAAKDAKEEKAEEKTPVHSSAAMPMAKPETKPAARVKAPTAAQTTTKHIPQKRSTGGGK